MNASKIGAINTVIPTQKVAFRGETETVTPPVKTEGQPPKKKHTLRNLLLLAAAITGGIFAYKHFNAKNVENIADGTKNIANDEFSHETLAYFHNLNKGN